MVQALVQSGVSVVVISSSDVIKGLTTDGSHLWHPMRDMVVNVPQVPRSNRLHSIAAACRFQTPFYARWVANVVEVAKQMHKTTKFDLVYSRSLPMFAHIAGFWCARTMKLPWVANINDPWDLSLFPNVEVETPPAFHTHVHMFWLRRTLLRADLVTYPCQGLQAFHARLSKLDHAAQIVPHIGYRLNTNGARLENQFRIVHAGKLGTTEVTRRSAKALLLGFRSFLNTVSDAARDSRLVLVGPEDKETLALVSQLGLQPNVERIGRVSYEVSLQYIESASICVLIETDSEESVFFPSKLADYIVCSKPVLALSPRVGLAADLANGGEVLRIDHDPDAVRTAMTSLYHHFKGGTLESRGPTPRLIEQFDGPSVAEGFLKACQPFLKAAL
jgi:glycosyltransferase involved in cell wall biosynthesis